MFVGSDQIVGFESQACHRDEGRVSGTGLSNILLVGCDWVSAVWVWRGWMTTDFKRQTLSPDLARMRSRWGDPAIFFVSLETPIRTLTFRLQGSDSDRTWDAYPPGPFCRV